MSPSTSSAGSGLRLGPFCLAWTVFVIYGSLVPLDFHPLPWAVAWQRLVDAPMLKLGVESRADWVANGVLYLPVGFLATAVLQGAAAHNGRKLVAGLLGLAFGVALALAVELAQTAFPPRTVSRNDLLAEAIGTALGMLIALAGTSRMLALLASWGRGGWALAASLAPFYALLFPALALFPFDLLLNAQEWQTKLTGPLVGLWLAESSYKLGSFRLLTKLAVETAAVMPLGALWLAWRQQARPAASARSAQAPSLLRAALVGAALGLVIEAAQLALASGQSQGVSVLTRSLGFALGVAAWQCQASLRAETLRAWLRRLTWPVLGLTLLLLVQYNKAWQGPWMSLGEVQQRFQSELHFVPFYYHYFTTEMHAITSLLAVSLSYAPLGLLGWAWHARPGLVATLAGMLSASMELSKLVARPTHPDPTNLLIAAAAAWLTQALVTRLFLTQATAPVTAAPDTGARR